MTLSTANQLCDVRFFNAQNLLIITYSTEYEGYLKDAADLLYKAGNVANTPSLKRLLKAEGDTFLSNDYYDSHVAWMELDFDVDITIGPYEIYKDTLYGYKDVKGPQIVAFNLPNDKRIVIERRTAMVMLKIVAKAKFRSILPPSAVICTSEEQKQYVDFDSMITHAVCHDCCHGIGSRTIELLNRKRSTVRLELQELHSVLEDAKADIVGVWVLQHLVDQDFLSNSLSRSMYVFFLAGCFRSIRFGLGEAHGKGQALQFDGGFVMHSNGTFSIVFSKEAVDSLSKF